MEKRIPVTAEVLASAARMCSYVMAWDHSLQQIGTGWTPGESWPWWIEKHGVTGTEALTEGAVTRRIRTLRNRQQIIKLLRLEKASKIILCSHQMVAGFAVCDHEA